ncbi:hypothetical protein BKA65DRAFT_596698 [Rhexocercosporidium sp. MPI-PUGE-AT-0058]|nr:hypothetical protein BKA65DRAFT_596698 [Rhexocercosporidium sp. MPI-PUGE-AT-0058]
MEFDLEAFTADVEAALRYQSPILQIGTAKTREGGDDNDHEERRQKDRGQKDDRDISGRYKRRRLDTSGERGRNSSVLSGNETGPIITLDSKTRNQSVDIDISNDDSDSEEDGVSLFLHPDMDMSTAISSTFAHPPHQPKFQLSSLISSEPLSSVPNFYAYIVKATISTSSYQEQLITEDDFGLEAKFPSYLDRESKHVSMLSFIWFCKLSKIMARIAVAKGRQKFERDWNGGEDEEGVEEGLRKLDGFERELRGWVEGFEGVVEEVLGLSKSSEVVGGGDGGVPVAVSTSLRASLYQPYLHLPPDHPALVEAGIDPLQRMKDGAREVAITCREVMGSKKCDAIPTWLVSWVTLPVAVYHVNQLIRQNSTPDQVLMPFLAQLVRRTSGALMLLRTVRAATRDHIERITEAENAGDNATLTDGGQKRADTVRLKFVYEGFDRAGENRIAEAKLLACVTKVVDEALELNGSRQEA